MRAILLAGVASLGLMAASGAANAVTYTYVGSWDVSSGVYWGTNPPVYSGQSAAAFLFGGTAANYAISTVDNNPANINFSAWLDGWGDGTTYAFSGNPAPQGYSLDSTGLGYNGCNIVNPANCSQSAYSAYVSDHLGGAGFINYAFLISGVAVPEPMTLTLLGAGLVGFAATRRRRTQG